MAVTGVVDLDRVRVEYDDVTAVDDLSLTVREDELFCLLGPSGCGKTTTLRTIAGFETPSQGWVALDGVEVTGRPPYERDCATVFQDWALFPNKTVVEHRRTVSLVRRSPCHLDAVQRDPPL